MTSYSFEVAAKNAVIGILKENHGEEYDIRQMSMLWFAELHNHRKAIFAVTGMKNRIYEAAYDQAKREIRVTEYECVSTTAIKEFDNVPHPKPMEEAQ